jgi:hypothetical protein
MLEEFFSFSEISYFCNVRNLSNEHKFYVRCFFQKNNYYYNFR